MALGVDPHSYANFQQIVVTDLHLSLRADFKEKAFRGYVDITTKVLVDGVKDLLLDTNQLAVARVVDLATNAPLLFTMPKAHAALGIELSIPIPAEKQKAGAEFKLRIYYATTEHSGGIQWFDPEQTSGKKHPYAYTQCEAILARTLLPCQDTPAVKAPYSVDVSVPSPLVVACSGVETGLKFEDDGYLTYSYHQKNPIPSYLIAIVAGKLKKAKVGPRSSVWTEAELLDAAVHEFSADTESFIKAGEELVKIPYDWGLYDMVVLPSAFPYGGMENPCLTFLSSSLLAGDRSLVNVVAHEIAHSWAGNLVTNSSWNDFAMNEGFCVYLERLILGKLRGNDYRFFEMLIGYNDLVKTCKDLADHPEHTKLQPDLTGIDPDDAFSKIPYEKGSLFLYFLETQIGGPEAMLTWVNAFYTANARKSVGFAEFKTHFNGYFKGKVDQAKLDGVNWEAWLHGVGLPEFNPVAALSNNLTKVCDEIAAKWIKNGGQGCTSDEFKALSSKQKMYFLDVIQTTGVPLAHDVLEKLDKLYEITKGGNVEILCRFLLISLKSNYRQVFDHVATFLSKHGRGLYVRPLYRSLNEVDHGFAAQVYKKNRSTYHSVIRNMYDGVLLK